MFKSKLKKLKNRNRIMLEGDLTIQTSTELQKIFEKAVTDVPAVVLNMEKVTLMDLTSLQLICAMIKTSEQQNTDLSVEGELPEAFKKIARDAGYLQYSDCHLSSGQFLSVKGESE